MRTAGQRTRALVEAVDMYPTLVELCGLPLPRQDLDGVSFVPLFAVPQRDWKTAAFNVSAPDGRASAMKTDRYDLIVHGQSGKTELYDLTRDPMEIFDLAPSSPQLLNALRRTLDAGPEAAKPPGIWRP
jgi:iduronate 2-sulfatase